MSRAPIYVLLSAALGLTACLDDLPGGSDDDLLIEAGGIANTPDKMIRVANVNFYKGSFGEMKTDARNFLEYLARGKYVPDIFTVQNLNHNGGGYHDCADVARKLEKYLEPKNVSYELYYPSEQGGSCVIYRPSRFVRTDTVSALGAWKGPGCATKGMSSVGVKLRDKKFHNATVSVISVHMPGECTTKNTRELRAWSNAGGADIRIIAGDFNTNVPGAPGEWGSIANMKEVFGSNGFKVAGVWGPLDWIWRKGQSNVSNETRVEYDDAKAVNASMNYSDHRGGFEDLTYQAADGNGKLAKEAELPETDNAPEDDPATTPPQVCDNDCWRAFLGVYAYEFPTTSNASDPRLARIIFDRKFYVNAYPDVYAWAQNKAATSGGTIFQRGEEHWLDHGIAEGRMGSPTFDPAAYMAWQPDVAAAFGATNYNAAITHYINYGRFEGRRATVFFDPAAYKARYADIAGFANYAVVDHFANNGIDEGRQGSNDFAPAWYMGNNTDVQDVYGANYYRAGMFHWIAWGRGAGRAGKP
jgi:hypothetical protein